VGRRSKERSDKQFCWLVGLMVSSLFGTAGLFARAVRWL
jgi:hypothetical protein